MPRWSSSASAKARTAGPTRASRVQEPLVDVAAIVDLAARYGGLAINRAYGNWQYLGRYRDALLQGAIELVQMFPPGGAAKNGADIRLCLDALRTSRASAMSRR